MTNFFTHFACLLDVGTPCNATRTLDFYNKLSEAGGSEKPPSEGFQYANTCSRSRINAFGGGAQVLDLATREMVTWTDTNGWLATLLDGGDPDA